MITHELDDDFFTEYAQEFASVEFAQQAQEALEGILSIKDEDGSTRSYEQIKAEAEVFFENPWVSESIAIMDSLARQFADFCNHNHAAADVFTGGMLGDIFAYAQESTHHKSYEHDEDEDGPTHPLSFKKKRRRLRRRKHEDLLRD